MTADQAILFVRAKRPNSIQTRGQLLCVREFAQFLIPLRNVFACAEPKANAVTLSQYLIRQRHLLHGYEARQLKNVPKIVQLICKLLLDIAENRQVIEEEVLEIPDLSAEIEKTVSQLAILQLDKELHGKGVEVSKMPKAEFVPSNSVLPSENEFGPLWKRRNAECLQPLSYLKKRLSYSDSDLRRAEFLLEHRGPPPTMPAGMLCPNSLSKQYPFCLTTSSVWDQKKVISTVEQNGSPLFQRRKHPKEVQRSRTFSLGSSSVKTSNQPEGPRKNTKSEAQFDSGGAKQKESSVNGKSACVLQGNNSFQPPITEAPTSSKTVFHIGEEDTDSSEEIPFITLQSELTLESRRVLVAQALAVDLDCDGDAELIEKVESWQRELNSREGAWDRICTERDPFVLSGLIWSWLEQLKEPVITKEDIQILAQKCDNPDEAIYTLEKGPQQTIVSVVDCVAHLHSIPEDVEEAFLARITKAFTKASSECIFVICLRGRGITGLKRNIFVENVLEKVKEEMAKIQVREHNVKSQTCRIHEEVMNLMCLDDDIPICSICKLFGDHNTHEVARLSEVYQGRKNSFIEEIMRIVLKSEAAATVSQELEKLQDQLLSTAEETKAMINAVGDSLLMEIQFKVSSLKMKVDKESAEKCNELQSALEDLQGSRRLYMKMKSLLEEHINPIQFLKEDKQLKIEVAKLFKEDRPLPVPKRDNISVGQYIEELIKGIDIKQVAISKADDLLVKVGDEYAAWSSSCSNVDTSSYDGLDQMIRKMMSSLTLKSSDANSSLSWECPSPYSTSGSSEDSYSPEEVKVITIQKTSL
ncbi:UNVERIFIED_CONTAM: hypothetical protein FKN15_019570 [Acipenser sinensis]